MNAWVSTLLGVFLCLGWPMIWVAVTVYLLRYRPPVAWRGFFHKRDEGEDE